MDRFFLTPSHWADAPVLEGEEAHHCVRVMRKSVGDVIEIFDGAGRCTRAVMESSDRRQVSLRLLSEPIASEKRVPQIELAVGIPKGKTMDLIIQKTVELGVNRIIPLMTEQGNVQLDEKEAEKKAEKWQRVALEACKQCGQNWLPEVAVPEKLDSWLEGREAADLEVAGALVAESKPLANLLKNSSPDSLRFLVGPEGDFSENEYKSILSAGFQPANLGALVLRVETAALLLLSAASYEFPR